MTKLPLELQHRLTRKLLNMIEDNLDGDYFDLVKEGGLTLEEARLVQVEASTLLDDSTIDGDSTVVEDWVLVRYLAQHLGTDPASLDPREALKVAEDAFLEASGWKRVVMPDKELWEAPRFKGLSEWQSIFPGDLIMPHLAVAAQKGYDRYQVVVTEELRRR